MAVKVANAGRADEEVAIGFLVSGQPFQAVADGVLIAAFDGVNVAGTQSGKSASPVAAVSESIRDR